MPEHDFDTARKQREETTGFRIGGESFRAYSVSAEDVAEYEDSPVGATSKEGLKQLDDFIGQFLDEEGRARWKELRARKTDAITLGDMSAVARWLMEQHSARPTMQPGSSERGRVKMPAGSAAAPSSPVPTPTG